MCGIGIVFVLFSIKEDPFSSPQNKRRWVRQGTCHINFKTFVALRTICGMMKIEKKHYTLHLHVILIVFGMTFRATMWQFGMQFF